MIHKVTVEVATSYQPEELEALVSMALLTLPGCIKVLDMKVVEVEE